MVLEPDAEIITRHACRIEALVEAANVGELELELAVGQRVLLGEPADAVLLRLGDGASGAGLGGGLDERLVAVPVLVFEVFPPAGEAGAALGSGGLLADENLGPGLEGFQVAGEALIQHGIAAHEDAVLDFKDAGLHLRAGVGVVPEGFVKYGGAGLEVGRGVEEHADGVGVEFFGAVAVVHIAILGGGVAERLPPFG